MPALPVIGGALVLGFLGHGVSLMLCILSLRYLGAARTGPYFSAAPFIGSVLAVVVMGDPISGPPVAAGLLMMVGVYLCLPEQHEHRHTHDAHHQHDHGPLGHRHRHCPDPPHHGLAIAIGATIERREQFDYALIKLETKFNGSHQYYPYRRP